MLLRNDLPRFRRELVAKSSAPGAGGEVLRARGAFLDRCPESPRFVVAGAPAMVRCEVDSDTGGPSRFENLDHVRYAPISFNHLADSGPQLTALRDEVVVLIDNQEPRLIQSKRRSSHECSPSRALARVARIVCRVRVFEGHHFSMSNKRQPQALGST